MSILKSIVNIQKKGFVVLIDPDSVSLNTLPKLVALAEKSNIDYFFIGGSTVSQNQMTECLALLNELTGIPLIIFPGHIDQINEKADALLFLSLISGRNPEYLIGEQVRSAAILKTMDLEIIPTGYILIDGGKTSSVSLTSDTQPIAANDIEQVINTAIAGQYLGMKLIYLEAGSGALNPVSNQVIRQVKANINCPLIVGGGIKNAKTAIQKIEAGADLIVVGNILEKDPSLIEELSAAVHQQNFAF